MNRMQFAQLRDLPNKAIQADIEFKNVPGASPNLVFDNIAVDNSQDWDVVVNGTYKPDIPSVTFNFVLRGVGPICRLDVNGTLHGDAGRTHKYDLREEDDTRLNLPHVATRPDLADKTAREVWEVLCQQANIQHSGRFVDPEGTSP